jgi:hypothetical protein
MSALEKTRGVLPLEDPASFFQKSADQTLRFSDVKNQCEEFLPDYVSFDNIIDALLFKSI